MKNALLMPFLLLAVPGLSTDLSIARYFQSEESASCPRPGLAKIHELASQSLPVKLEPGYADAKISIQTDPLRETAEAAMKALKLPEGAYRYQNRADIFDEFEDGSRVFVERTFLYRRLHEGTPVFGPGTSVQVKVSADGQLKSVQADWAPNLETPWRIEDFAHIDPDRVLESAFPPGEIPFGVGLKVLGLRYCTRPSQTGLEAEPVVMVRAMPKAPGGEGLGEHLFLRILP
jgi:hypothetical protein